MNLILEKTRAVTFFTDMAQVLAASQLKAEDYDWYISDIAFNGGPAHFSREDQWMTGPELKALLAHPPFQFEWAVFSAVQPGARPPVLNAPYADGNPDYWHGTEIRPQLPGALFEIACWDNSAVILVGLPDAATAAFRATFADAKPLPSTAPRA
ncbi:hypothetical protein JCM19000A_22540 [Silvimonas sp. JCM 19000]